MQKTLAKSAEFKGIGVHGGADVVAIVEPAEANSGIHFIRTDVTGQDNAIPARFNAVVDTRMCTVLANAAGVSISTVEHIMAALAGLGVDNAVIKVNGPEIPIMDGSSAPFVRGFLKAGIRELRFPAMALRVLKTVEVQKDGKVARLEPHPHFAIDFTIDFDAEIIGRQNRQVEMVNGSFVQDLCHARTFGMLSDVQKLRELGLARGGSLENALVVDGARVLNPSGLRYEDEFVRHKILDAVGDLALAGAALIGRYHGYCAGHEMTNLLLRKLFSDAQAVVLAPQTAQNALGHNIGSVSLETPALPKPADSAHSSFAAA